MVLRADLPTSSTMVELSLSFVYFGKRPLFRETGPFGELTPWQARFGMLLQATSRFADYETCRQEDFARRRFQVAHPFLQGSERGIRDSFTRLVNRRELRRHDGRYLHVVKASQHYILWDPLS